MKSCTVLPEGYAPLFSMDLQENKRLMLLVNIIGTAIAILAVVPALFFVPFSALFDMSAGLGAYALRFAALLVGMVLYVVLHELVHGIFMRAISGVSVRYGFTGMYAYAGSDAYFGKASYLLIAMAPVVIWGVVLAVACCFVPAEWFWVVYLIQVVNLSGAGGDIYVTFKFCRLPRDILVRDTGVAMTVFGPK